MADCRRPEVLEAGIIYDEAQRRSHDLELGVRLAERFRILALPIVMGTHHTVSYYAPRRVGGLLSGHALGLCLQLLLIAALLFQSSWLTAFAAGLLALDIARFAWQGRLRDYIPELSRPGSS